MRAILLAAAVVLAPLPAVNADAANVPAHISAAVADAARPASDKERDADRKPAESLAFSGVKPGDTVVELLPGGGYFTRLFSAAVGPKGKVYAVAPPRRPTAPADSPDPAARLNPITSDAHYANVSVSVQRPADYVLPQGADLVWTSQNYHDFHNVPDFDVGNLDKNVFKALKPGGVYIVLDHAAEAGSGLRDTSTLHRIDPEAVKKEVLAAGFTFEGESPVLRNKDDAHTDKVFEGAIRGHTDQFIYKFRKPN